jgi:hypothetical protein
MTLMLNRCSVHVGAYVEKTERSGRHALIVYGFKRIRADLAQTQALNVCEDTSFMLG